MNKQELKEGQEVWVRCKFCEYAGANQAFVLIQGEGALAQLYDIKDSEPQKVTVPKFVAEWIEECKAKKMRLFDALMDNEAVNDWLDWGDGSNEDLFARAWLDGFVKEVE